MMPDLSLSHFNGICIAHARRWSTVSVPGWILIQKMATVSFSVWTILLVMQVGKKKGQTRSRGGRVSYLPTYSDSNMNRCFVLDYGTKIFSLVLLLIGTGSGGWFPTKCINLVRFCSHLIGRIQLVFVCIIRLVSTHCGLEMLYSCAVGSEAANINYDGIFR